MMSKQSGTSATPTIRSVTCFLHCGEEYLFIHRTKKGNVTDAGRLNGIGGKLEPGEDFLSAALRETAEETGVAATLADCQLKAIVTMTGGYPEDWVMCFFSINVADKNLVKFSENEEGALIWLHRSEVLTSPYTLVDDLHYCWNHLSDENEQRVLFAGCRMNEAQTVEVWTSRLL